jgi:hypothetical protein
MAVIAVGLIVHRGLIPLSPTVRDVAGDALWAAMLYCWVSACLPAHRSTLRALIALSVCTLVEVSQLLHTPALDAARATTLGRLVLGSDFDRRDLIAYAAGVIVALRVEMLARRRTQARSTSPSTQPE